MGKTVNTVTLLGHVGRDPEIRSTGVGGLIANLSLATSERFKDHDGNWAEKPEWHNLVAFAKAAEVVRDYVKKGSKLYIEGRLQTRSWDDKETNKKLYRTEVVVKEFILLDQREGRDEERAPASRIPAYSSKPNYSQEPVEDEIPF